MKKILDEWNEYLDEFKMPDQAPADDILSASAADVKVQIQSAIKKYANLHASGRPIDKRLLGGTINEAYVEEVLETKTKIRENLQKFDQLKEMYQDDINFLEWMTNSFSNMSYETIGSLSAREATKMTERLMEPDVKKKLYTIYYNFKHNVDILYDFAMWLESSNYYKVIVALALFTGSNVGSIRDPNQYASSLARKRIFTGGDIFSIMGDSEIRNKFQFRYLNWEYRKLIPILRFYKRQAANQKIKNTNINFKTEAYREFENYEILKLFFESPNFEQVKRFYSLMSTDVIAKLNAVQKIAQKKPSKQDYKNSSQILKQLSAMPHTGGETLYRGMALPKATVEGMDTMATRDKTEFVFSFYDISSWSVDDDTAIDFAIDSAGNNPDSIPLLFIIPNPRRGIYLEQYSIFPNEDEFISGGDVKVVSGEYDEANEILRLTCEQI